MANTITIAGSIGWAQSWTGWKGLAIGANSEPALSSANIIIQQILAAPFSWNWNRNSITFNTVAGIQDYLQAVSTFGFIEKASYKIPSATITNTVLAGGIATYTANNTFQTGDIVAVTGTTNGSGVFNVSSQSAQAVQTATATTFTLLNSGTPAGSAADTGIAVAGTTTEISQNAVMLGTGSELGSPARMAAQKDDNAGNITFRFLPIPDRVYTVEIIFQKRIAALMTATTQTWTPIPDHFSFIYQWGFLALMLSYNGDSRWQAASQKFVGSLLGAAEGLTDEQKNIFQTSWLNMITEQQAKSQNSQTAGQARTAE